MIDVYAEDLNYWKTSRTGADTWLDKAEAIIEDYGGTVTHRGTLRELDREMHVIQFTFGADSFRAAWPVLESKTEDRAAARRQAATMLYHDVKARAVRFKVFGARIAFFDHLMLPDGRVASQIEAAGLAEALPSLPPWEGRAD